MRVKVRVVPQDDGLYTVAVSQRAPGYTLSLQKRDVPDEKLDAVIAVMIEQARTPIDERVAPAAP